MSIETSKNDGMVRRSKFDIIIQFESTASMRVSVLFKSGRFFCHYFLTIYLIRRKFIAAITSDNMMSLVADLS